MFFRCYECDHIFEEGEERTIKEPHGEIIKVCPMCSGSYDEVEPCVICGSYDHDISEKYCDNCRNEIFKRFKNLISENFTIEERVLLNELLEDEEI